MPSYKQTPLQARLSERLGIQVEIKQAVNLTQIKDAQIPVNNDKEIYFGWTNIKGKWLQRQIRAEPVDTTAELNKSESSNDLGIHGNAESKPQTLQNLYLQFGWLDGVGIYKG